MRKNLLTALAFASLTAFASCSNGNQQTAQEEQKTEKTALEFAMEMGIGWNLGNNMDAHENGIANETCWHDQPATQELFNKVKASGFHTVRIPTTWMGHIGDAPEYKIEDAWLNREAELVEFAHKAGLKVIVNIHHDGFGDQKDEKLKKNHWLDIVGASKDSALNANIEAKLSAVWKQIATKFKDCSADWLIFETLNEIQDGNWGHGSNLTDNGAQYATLNHWNQVAVDAIRSAGGENLNRYIGIPGYVTSPQLTMEHLVMPKDEAKNKIMVAVHSYSPWDYAGSAKYSEWGHTGKDVVPGDKEENYVAVLDALKAKYIDNGIPVYFGEMGCVNRQDTSVLKFREYYMEYVVKAMKDRNIACIYWDNGYLFEGDEAFGLMNHQTGEYLPNGENICKAMSRAWDTEDSTYTLQSIYDRAPISSK